MSEASLYTIYTLIGVVMTILVMMPLLLPPGVSKRTRQVIWWSCTPAANIWNIFMAFKIVELFAPVS